MTLYSGGAWRKITLSLSCLVRGWSRMSVRILNLFLLSVLALGWPSAGRAQTTPVYSVNMMGFQKLPVPAGGLSIASVPYGNAPADINTVLRDQLTAGGDLNTADTAYFFDATSQVYRVVYLYLDGTNVVWRDNDSQETAQNPVIPGLGFWIRSNQGADQSLIVSGEVLTQDAITNAVVPGLQLLAYPYPAAKSAAALTLAAHAVKGETLESADVIYLWRDAIQQFQTLFFYTDGTLVDFATGDPATNVLKEGEAFWYKHLGSGFSWVEAKPYALP